MSKNLIPKIAKMLGVEMQEKFKVKGLGDTIYSFTEDGLLRHGLEFPNEQIYAGPLFVMDIIRGEREIIKLPYEPERGDGYWTFVDDFLINLVAWNDTATDYCRKATGCVFRTGLEAEEALPSKYKELTGKDWVDND